MNKDQVAKVSDFFSTIEKDPKAKARFEKLAKSNDVSGFEEWAEEAGCDVDVVASFMPQPEVPQGELADDVLDQVSGGASRWFAHASNGGPSVSGQPVDVVSQRINTAWARWQKLQGS